MQTRSGSNVVRSRGATSSAWNSPGANLSTAASERWPASFVSVYMPSHRVPEACRWVGFSKPSAAIPSEQMWSSRVSAIIQPYRRAMSMTWQFMLSFLKSRAGRLALLRDLLAGPQHPDRHGKALRPDVGLELPVSRLDVDHAASWLGRARRVERTTNRE